MLCCAWEGGVLGRAELCRERMCSRPQCLRTLSACPGLGVALLRSAASGGSICTKKKAGGVYEKSPTIWRGFPGLDCEKG
ncbi:hypothetical protein XMV201_000095 [Aliiroseovarius sp. xm-v-201]|nr:hypothetical protein [Aliiroseovarius sp. xm-m-314]NRP48350.1 hypothetical protein [Aliiroseovarius sp. xm-m-354]NRP79178.1 hypothetical protein [Aliiroseovarius sp. xm-v-209]NRQ03103.1 hypothetical protein [Aliiroseovarius sp. xm-m-309]NRQ06309.1 hypothetical protein [Aliiroseovarius sp. xm-v-201]NRQ10299.1 hypothetical protein [Aliiroseovarius sp. xm-v-208]